MTKIINNYHQISILPYFFKILEILSDNQYGFFKGQSNEMALLHMINDITEGFDKKLFCIGIFIDLSKSFDTVDYKLLIHKLKIMGLQKLHYNGL